jgi:hypothetical protein
MIHPLLERLDDLSAGGDHQRPISGRDRGFVPQQLGDRGCGDLLVLAVRHG